MITYHEKTAFLRLGLRELRGMSYTSTTVQGCNK